MYSEFFSRFAKNAALSFCLAYLGIAILSLVFSREDELPSPSAEEHREVIQIDLREE